MAQRERGKSGVFMRCIGMAERHTPFAKHDAILSKSAPVRQHTIPAKGHDCGKWIKFIRRATTEQREYGKGIRNRAKNP